MKNKCVYIIYRNDTGKPCYVGMGTHKRFLDKKRNIHVNRIDKKFGTTREKAIDGITTEQAHKIEKKLIKFLVESGIDLCNMTNGGDGSDGWKPTIENKINMSKGHKRYFNSVTEDKKKKIAYTLKKNAEKLMAPVFCSNGMDFKSRSDAVKWLISIGKEYANESGISAAVYKNGQNSAYGYFWANSKEELIEDKIGVDVKVHCSNGMTFKSIVEASSWVASNIDNLANPGSAISNASSGKSKSAYGFLWWRDGDEPKSYTVRKYKPKIACSNGMEFFGLKECSDWLKNNGFPKATSTRVLSVIDGSRNSAYGFTWKYVD